ncbi:MAG: hypothetical protein V1797_12960 [Pseudomonadota bacterium]
MKRLTTYLGLLLLAACLAMTPGLAQAAAPAPADWAKLFPASAQLDTKALAPALRQLTLGEPLPPPMRLRLLVPVAGWQKLPQQEVEPGTQRLAALIWPQAQGPIKVEVFAHRLAAEVDAADWLLALLVRGGATVLGTRQDLGLGGAVFEALAMLPARADEGETRLLRAAVLRRGQQLFMVRCLAPYRQFAELAQLFAACTLSLEPQAPQGEELIGQWPQTCLTGGLCLTGPGQPSRREGAAGAGAGLAVWDLIQEGVTTGRMQVRFDPAQPGGLPAARIQALREDLAAQGLDLNWSLGSIRFDHTQLPGTACLVRGKGWHQGQDAELWALLWGDGQRTLKLWLVSVGQTTNLPAWMQNKRAFELALRSLRLGPRP